MKKLFFFLFISGFATAQTFNGSTGLIPDDLTPVDFTVNVSGLPATLGTELGLVKVCLDITHAWDSDLNVELISPSGITIKLFTAVGGDGDNFYGTCLSQSAWAVIGTASSPFNGTFKPEETLGNMNNGQSGNGIWKLHILDTYPADPGTVNSWSLEFGAGAAVPFVFTSSTLPIVLINTDGNEIVDDPSIFANMKIIDNGEGNVNYVTDVPNNYDGNIAIEFRGHYSQSLPQKPYKIETLNDAYEEENVSILGMPSEHDWCLIANYNDKVFMRNTLPYKLFGEMGHYSPRSRYCEVTVNGVYMGVYMMMEKIKRNNNRVNIAKLDTNENTGLNVTGGYILLNDYWDETNSWLLNYHPIDHPDFDVRLVYEYPKPENITAQQQAYIQDFINDYETALYGNNFADPLSGYAKYIDTDSFIDYFIVNELARNNDGFKKSCFFNKNIDTAETLAKLNAGPVWDFDWAWKNIDECSIFAATDGSGWAHEINDCSPDINSPGWYVRLLQDPAFANNLRCRWDYFRQNILSESAINNWIDATALQLDAAQARHFEKWGNLGVSTGTPEVDADPATFAGQLTKFKDWISLRIDWLDANIPGSSANCALAVNGNIMNTFSAYPNPAVNEVVFRSTDNGFPDAVEIYDLMGKTTLSRKSLIDGKLNVSALSNGVYLCKIIIGEKSEVLKLAVAK